MKRFKNILGFLFLVLISFANFAQAPSHAAFDQLLKKHVSENGNVNYGGFIKDKVKFDEYLKLLSNNPPAGTWSTNQKLSYWINAYNAFTINLVLQYADKKIKSIKDIGDKIKIPFVNTPWDIKFIEIGKEKYDLNAIEHGIIRKQFAEPRIHFALVCAAKSCPPLLNEAYTPEKLNAQLNLQAKKFINDNSKNTVAANKAELSSIFDWYGADFKTKNMIDYINQYADIKADNTTKITYKKYDWALNGTLK
jgi:Protein of unknown function, DUF547